VIRICLSREKERAGRRQLKLNIDDTSIRHRRDTIHFLFRLSILIDRRFHKFRAFVDVLTGSMKNRSSILSSRPRKHPTITTTNCIIRLVHIVIVVIQIFIVTITTTTIKITITITSIDSLFKPVNQQSKLYMLERT